MPKRIRVIVHDPERAKMWREAWDLLLTDRYNMEQICQALHDRGYVRKSGKPWMWIDPNTGEKVYANNHLARTFKNPFYAGWSISKKYGIKRGDKRGNWPALVTDAEFDEGLAILKRRRENMYRVMHYTYPLSSLIHMRVEE